MVFDEDRMVRLAIQEGRRYGERKLGRPVTDDEAISFIPEINRIQSENAEKALREFRAKQSRRKAALSERKRNRNLVPENFHPAISTEKLSEFSAKNQSYCSGVVIGGSERERLKINCDLAGFNFDNSNIANSIFVACDLSDASFVGAKLENVEFDHDCNLERADFTGANFESVRIEKDCRIANASFRSVTFKKGTAIDFDANFVSGAAFVSPRTDRWHSLAKSYSSFYQILNLVAAAIYFGPIFLKLHLFKLASTGMNHILSVNPSLWRTFEGQSNTVSVLDFVFGRGGRYSISLAVILFLFQGMRLFMTWKISPLIEVERQSGYTPSRESIEPLLITQKIMLPLGVASIIAFLYEIYSLCTQSPLFVPALRNIAQ